MCGFDADVVLRALGGINIGCWIVYAVDQPVMLVILSRPSESAWAHLRLDESVVLCERALGCGISDDRVLCMLEHGQVQGCYCHVVGGGE